MNAIWNFVGSRGVPKKDAYSITRPSWSGGYCRRHIGFLAVGILRMSASVIMMPT